MTEIKLYRKEEGILRYLNNFKGRQKFQDIFEIVYPFEEFNSSRKENIEITVHNMINKLVNVRLILDINKSGVELINVPDNFKPSPIQENRLNKLMHHDRYVFDNLRQNLEEDVFYQNIVENKSLSHEALRWIIKDLKDSLGMTEKKINLAIFPSKSWHYRMINLDFSDNVSAECFEFEDKLMLEMLRNYLNPEQWKFFNYLYSVKKPVSNSELAMKIFQDKNKTREIKETKHYTVKKLYKTQVIEAIGMRFVIENIRNYGYELLEFPETSLNVYDFSNT